MGVTILCILTISDMSLLLSVCVLAEMQQKQSAGGSGFSLGFGSIGRIGMRGSSSGGSKPVKANIVSSKPPVVPSSLLKAEADDDIAAFTSTALTTR